MSLYNPGFFLAFPNLESLESRSMNFAKKAENCDKYMHWFRPRTVVNTRQSRVKYIEPQARTERLSKSAIPYLTRLLNQHRIK